MRGGRVISKVVIKVGRGISWSWNEWGGLACRGGRSVYIRHDPNGGGGLWRGPDCIHKPRRVEAIVRGVKGCAGCVPAQDIVIGISASGITPFVRGAVTRAGPRMPGNHRIHAMHTRVEGSLHRNLLSVGRSDCGLDQAQGGTQPGSR